MLRTIGLSAMFLMCLALVATGQEKKPAAPATKKKPAATPAAEKPAAADESNADEGSADVEAVAAVLRSYRDAFNKHDPQALAALWSPQGVYVDRETGAKFTGRDAIIADLETVFEERPDVQLDASVTDVRFVRPDVAVVEGQASSSIPGEEAGRMTFSAILVKHDDQWLVESVEETAIAAPETAYDALKDLEWMVGHWVDETDEAAVDTVVRWSKNRSFLIRSFNIALDGEDAHEGTQVIGWDPVEKRIRSWIFDSDGSFGEGAWFRNGDTWMSRVTVTLADGRLASGTQVFTPTADDHYTVETIGREIDGEPSPSAGPINVVRADGPADADDAEINPPAGE